MCAFDDDDRTLGWNRSFLRIFPEHEGHVRVGEPYTDNLRRFYLQRLGKEELPHLDEYIAAGVTRHRTQSAPFAFEHHGRRITAASLPMGPDGRVRVRVWRTDEALPADHAPVLMRLEGRSPPARADDPSLLDHVPDGLAIIGRDGRIEWINKRFALLYRLRDLHSVVGLRFEEVCERTWHDAGTLRPDDGGDLPASVLQEALRFAGAPFELPLPGDRWCRVTMQPTAGGATFSTHVDITELKRQQRRLSRAEREARTNAALASQKSAVLETTLENIEDGVVLVGPQGRVELFNRRALELLNLPAAALQNRPAMPEALGPPTVSHEELRRPNGRIVEMRSLPLPDGSMLRTYADVTEQRLNEERMHHAANHDALTGLLQRGLFMEFVASEIALSRRAGGGCMLLFLDLDGFKPINDRHGHAVGDRALVWVAQRLQETVRDADLVARLGGDEFAVLMRGVTDPAAGRALSARLEQALAEDFVVESHVLRLGASIGMACCPGDAEDAERLLRRADEAMYACKAARRAT